MSRLVVERVGEVTPTVASSVRFHVAEMPDPFERCAPFQPSSCLCSELRLNTSSKVPLPACRPTVACGRAASKRPVFGAAGAAGNATIAILYGFQRERTRNSFTRAPLASYLKDMTLIMRLVLSLRAVDTALPIQLLVTRCGNGEDYTRRTRAVQIAPPPGVLPTRGHVEAV